MPDRYVVWSIAQQRTGKQRRRINDEGERRHFLKSPALSTRHNQKRVERRVRHCALSVTRLRKQRNQCRLRSRMARLTNPKMNNKRVAGMMLLFLGIGLNVSALINKRYPGPATYELVVLVGSLCLFGAAGLMWMGKTQK
jgi:hypothetical protein